MVFLVSGVLFVELYCLCYNVGIQPNSFHATSVCKCLYHGYNVRVCPILDYLNILIESRHRQLGIHEQNPK